jgi:phosphatidylglycerophosphatase A
MKIKKLYENIATVFGLGHFPIAPGTAGSLAGLIPCLLLHNFLALYIVIFILLFAAGVISAGKVEEETGQEDPSFVVIDEFACIFLVFLFIPATPLYIITGFIIYRIFDVLKPPPIKSLEKLEGGWGIMLDDAAAAIYTNIILQILTRLV